MKFATISLQKWSHERLNGQLERGLIYLTTTFICNFQVQLRFIVHPRLVSKLQESKFLIYRKNALKARWFGIFIEPIMVAEHSLQRSPDAAGCYPFEDFYCFRSRFIRLILWINGRRCAGTDKLHCLNAPSSRRFPRRFFPRQSALQCYLDLSTMEISVPPNYSLDGIISVAHFALICKSAHENGVKM